MKKRNNSVPGFCCLCLLLCLFERQWRRSLLDLVLLVPSPTSWGYGIDRNSKRRRFFRKSNATKNGLSLWPPAEKKILEHMLAGSSTEPRRVLNLFPMAKSFFKAAYMATTSPSKSSNVAAPSKSWRAVSCWTRLILHTVEQAHIHHRAAGYFHYIALLLYYVTRDEWCITFPFPVSRTDPCVHQLGEPPLHISIRHNMEHSFIFCTIKL